MNGESFRKETVVKAHKNCRMCDIITEIAVNNFRESHSFKTNSSSGDHWVEVTR